MTIAHCPVCRSSDLDALYPEHEGPCITSDMLVLPRSSLHNRLCNDCGLIFNAGGPRGATASFYRDSYSLMMHTAESAIQSFAGPQPVSQAERTFLILRELVDLPKQGRVLEVGAGKGEFLGFFNAELPDWQITAFEPSSAFSLLKERFSQAHIERCDYSDFRHSEETVDLIVALGVLEHVENPLDMLTWGNRLLVDGGIFYIRVPHFARNPNDLFCADHLSKLTEGTLSSLAVSAGFEVVASKEAGVPIFIVLRKVGAPRETRSSVLVANRRIAAESVSVAHQMMDALVEGSETASQKGEGFAIFGLGSAGLFAPLFASIPATDIVAYIDENRSQWGGQIHGRPIGGLDLVGRENIRHVALAISPVYVEQVSAKLRPLGVSIYAPGASPRATVS